MSNIVVGVAIIFVSILASLLSKIQFPRDAERTLAKVRDHTLRVGYTNAAPWVYPAPGGAQGIEAKIVSDFANTLHARVDWVEGTEEQLYNALENDEIDLLIAGITDKTPWKDKVGLTKPYLETELDVGQPTSQPPGNSESIIEGQWVAVRKGTAEGYYVRKKKAKPFYTAQLPVSNMFSVGYDWQIQSWNLRNTGIVLKKESHVMAVPPGENAFLLALDKYLFLNKETIRDELNKKE